KSGKGRRVCIIGAGKRGHLCGEWVSNTQQVWAADNAASIDYHGNFTATLFEQWFDNLVERARECGHKVLYTPPYHPELQPIDLIWSSIELRRRRPRWWSCLNELPTTCKASLVATGSKRTSMFRRLRGVHREQVSDYIAAATKQQKGK
ncbi:TPA: hypothetical protein N0F65_010604, partial [Lagenidium giganteum]